MASVAVFSVRRCPVLNHVRRRRDGPGTWTVRSSVTRIVGRRAVSFRMEPGSALIGVSSEKSLLDITFIVRARRALTGRRALQARVLIA